MTFKGRRTHFGAQYRFVKRDRQVKFHIGAVQRELRMRRNRNRDQHVASSALTGHALTAQTDLLPAGDASGNLHVEILAGWQAQPPGNAMRRFRQRHGHLSEHIGAGAYVLGLELGTTCRAATAKGVTQNVFEAAKSAAPAAPSASCPGCALKALGAKAEALVLGVAAAEAAARAARAGAETLETLKLRLALRVDFAAIEGLALVFVADDFVRRVQLGKA